MRNTPRSRLLLLELMISLVVFVICSVVCISLLVYAKGMTRDSTDLTNAVYLAQSAAETVRQCETMEEASALLGGTFNGRDFTVSYGENWQPDPSGPISMTLTAGPDAENNLRTVTIDVSRSGGSIYSLTTTFVLPGQTAGAGGELDTGEVVIQ